MNKTEANKALQRQANIIAGLEIKVKLLQVHLDARSRALAKIRWPGWRRWMAQVRWARHRKAIR